MGYAVDRKSQMHSELGLLMPRLKAFAAALTGSEAMSLTLLKATRNHLLSRTKDRGHTPLALWAFTQMHALWAGRMKPPRGGRGPQADPRLFCPRSRAGDAGGAVRFARLLAQLGPQERATLHLVYGERLSYDEAAEVFGVPVGAITTRLAQSHAQLAQIDEQDSHAVAANAASQRGQSEKGARRPGRAA